MLYSTVFCCGSLQTARQNRYVLILLFLQHALHERKAGARTVHNQQLPQCHKTRTSPLAELTSKASNLLKNTQSGAAALGLSVLLLAGGAAVQAI